NTELLGYLQVFPGLMERVIDVLRVIHEVGKESTNIFSPSDSLNAEVDLEHITEGFKSHLFRLIGNMCYMIKEIQDKVIDLVG
ncbi:hypothetical protein, partial [Salmonella enterica]|uniref:hypothetical protein n=1 Tax=Salmonella enterica TaxID=28901 RepID=UPI0032979247